MESVFFRLLKEDDRGICLSTPRLFWAVGAFYAVFDQTPDEEVKQLLGDSLSPSGEGGGESNPHPEPG